MERFGLFRISSSTLDCNEIYEFDSSEIGIRIYLYLYQILNSLLKESFALRRGLVCCDTLPTSRSL